MNIVKKFFADKDGNIVIWQCPNLPILVWAGARLLMLVPALAQFNNFLSLVAFGALFTWAWMEIFDGANLFRKALGGAVMLLTIIFAL